jgi:hypothetical protein
MKKWLRQIRVIIWMWFKTRKINQQLWPIAVTKSKPKINRRKDNYGAMYFREDLLENLEIYFEDIKYLRKMYPAAYAQYKQLGAQIVSKSSYLHGTMGLEPIFEKQLPSFGMTHFPSVKYTKDENESVPTRLAWFEKLSKSPHGVEIHNGTTYRCELLIAHTTLTKCRGIMTYYITVENGKVRLLREQNWRNLKTLKGKQYSFTKGWNYPLRALTENTNQSIQDYLANLFHIVATMPSVAQAGIQVRVSKEDVTGVFNIDMLRTPYFFDDREKVKNEKGSTKRIFHIVRAHKRMNTTIVRTHFRGLRDFDWNGFKVHISVPGLHHKPYQEFDLPGIDSEEVTTEKTMPSWKVAKLIIKETNQVAGGRSRAPAP